MTSIQQNKISDSVWCRVSSARSGGTRQFQLNGNMSGEDGFQEAGGEKEGQEEGETRSRQTSEGKQKLMKQDVTVDGSLHPSKHGTLAEPVLTHPFSLLPLFLSLFLILSPSSTRSYISFRRFLSSSLITLQAPRRLPSRYSKPLRFSVAPLLIGPLISIYTCVYISRSIELGLVTSPGEEYQTQAGSAHRGINRHKSGEFSYESLHFAAHGTHPVAHYYDSRPLHADQGDGGRDATSAGRGYEIERRH